MSMTPRTDSDALERIWASSKLEFTYAGSLIGSYWDRKGGFATVEYVRADFYDALRKERDALKEQVIAYGGPWAVKYAHDRGLPEGHLHPTHYDDLANAGARMDSFTRATEGQS